MIWIFEREASMAGPKHILIVDDNGDVRDMLQYRGYRVNAFNGTDDRHRIRSP
jgi:hypothetical protein